MLDWILPKKKIPVLDLCSCDSICPGAGATKEKKKDLLHCVILGSQLIIVLTPMTFWIMIYLLGGLDIPCFTATLPLPYLTSIYLAFFYYKISNRNSKQLLLSYSEELGNTSVYHAVYSGLPLHLGYANWAGPCD